MKKAFCGILLCSLVVAGPVTAQTYTKTETTEYHDDLSLWVLGQVKRTTTTGLEVGGVPVASPVVVDETTFGWKALPWKRYKYGKLQSVLTYRTTDGVLQTVSDGRDGVGGAETTITLSSWKRGVPQSIQYPATPESPSGATESAVVSDDGTIASVTDENGSKTCYSYDAMGRLASITYPSESMAGVCDTSSWTKTTQSFQQVATTEYGVPANHWRQTVSTGNARKIVYFDALWRPLVEESYDNVNAATTRSVTVRRYAPAGPLAFQSYPVASVASYADTALAGTRTFYDALDRVKRVEQDSELGAPSVTMTSYLGNANGSYTLVTNPRAKQTRTWFQAFDRPDYSKPVTIWHPEGAYTHIKRDAVGKPTLLRRSNSSSPTGGTVAINRTYAYDGYQQLCQTIEPETGSSFMGYDAAGNLLWSAAGYATTTPGCMASSSVAARRADRTYDARNRITSLSFPDGMGNTIQSYTPDGRLASTTADNGGPNQVTTNYSYNRRGLPVSEQMLWGSINWSIGYGYNANAHLASQSYPGSLSVAFAPNALGQPTQAGTYATGVSYFPNGAIKQFTYGNGIVHTLTQNSRGLPDSSKDAYGATSYLNDGYDYDANGNVAAITDGATGTGQRGNRTMTYDGLDRLKTTTSAMYGATGASYTYDVLDNLTRVTVGGASARDTYYCYDAATWRLTFVRSGPVCTGASASPALNALDYDLQGNLKQKDARSFTFDFGNRLRAAGGSPGSSYIYDAAGRRVRDYTTASKYSLYSQSGQLVFDSDLREAQQHQYIYLGGSLVAIREKDTVTGTYTSKYQHSDALGSPVVVTDANRVVLERNEYEPYGKVIAPASPQDGPGYTGHVFDAATGMNYMQQRYYDPGIGRFLSVDPVTAYDGDSRYFNRYWYAAGNPYKYTDPDGRILDTVADIGFVAYSTYKLATEPSWTNAAALGADLLGAAVPFATGLGAGVRATSHGVDAARAADQAGDSARFTVTPNGTALDTSKDVNLVSTSKPTSEGGAFLQIHSGHKDAKAGDVRSHTHTSQSHADPATGVTRTTRSDARPTTSGDIDRADKAVKSGEMRQRHNRDDKGG